MTTFGLNAQRLAGQPFGVGRYLEYLLRNWADQLTADERMIFYVRQPPDARMQALAEPERLTCRHIGPDMSGMVWENVRMHPNVGEIDVLFGPSYTLPVAYRRPSVVAIHSVNELMAGAHNWWYNLTYRQLYKYSGHLADRVIVPCQTTLHDVVTHYHIPEAKVDVIPQGADPGFRPLNDPERDRATRIRLLGDDVPYVLWVGKMSVRRNSLGLIRAFGRLKERTKLPHKLLLFGTNHKDLPLFELIDELGLGEVVIQTDGKVAEHRELIDVYNAADVFIQPSLYEGWSMTTVEALACGKAVIASNRGGLGEIARGYAHMVEDPTPEVLADALEAVLTDDTYRAELEALARERGTHFTWADTARRTLDVMRRVAHA